MRSHIRNITRRAAKMNSVDGIICEVVKLVVRKAVTRIVARLIMGREVVPRVVTKRSTGTSQKERYQKERYQKEHQKIVLARLAIRRSVTRRIAAGRVKLIVTRTVDVTSQHISCTRRSGYYRRDRSRSHRRGRSRFRRRRRDRRRAYRLYTCDGVRDSFFMAVDGLWFYESEGLSQRDSLLRCLL